MCPSRISSLTSVLVVVTTLACAQVTAYPDTLVPQRLRATLLAEGAFVAGGMAVLYANWYADRARVPFHTYDDAAGYLQVDKAGHAYGAYLYSTAGYHGLRAAGVPKGPALWWGGGLGLYLQTPIELFDGLYEGWGFSWSDMLANAAGTALAVGQYAAFDGQVARLKFSFWRSSYAREANGYLGASFAGSLLNDYNGHTYWLSVPVSRLTPKRVSARLPAWLALAVGYGAGGMFGEFANRSSYRGVALPRRDRYREFYLPLDIDWALVRARHPLARAALRALNVIKVPFPALSYGTRGQWRLRATGY